MGHFLPLRTFKSCKMYCGWDTGIGARWVAHCIYWSTQVQKYLDLKLGDFVLKFGLGLRLRLVNIS